MKRATLLGLVVAAGLGAAGLASSAAAQDASQFGGLIAAGAEGLGQSLGESAVGGSSVFVSATGHAALPAPIADAYLINIEGQSASAVEASRLHDERLKTAQGIAARYNVSVELGATSFSREVDQQAQMRRNQRQQARFQAQLEAQRSGHPTPPAPAPDVDTEPQWVFVARTGVRFSAANAAQLPAFLDALKAAGVDNLSGNLGSPAMGGLFHASEVLGFGSLAKVDEAVWDRASQDAIASARRQAAVLAGAAGRELGEARQILFLTRSVQGDQVTVTVAVRFGFAKPAR